MGNKWGSNFFPTPELGICGRADLDKRCLFELDEFVNAHLFHYAVEEPAKEGLYCAGANPDGERRVSRDILLCWEPKELALKLKEQLFSDERFDHYRQFMQAQKTFRSRVYTLQQRVAEEIKKREEEEEAAKKRQFDWEQQQLDLDC
jgi:hypothetical protein